MARHLQTVAAGAAIQVFLEWTSLRRTRIFPRMAQRTLELPKLYRFLEINDIKPVVRTNEAGVEETRYEIGISSEYEVARWFGKEILSHDRNAIDLGLAKRGLSLILDHYGEQVGVVEDIRVDDDRVLRGFMRFSDSALGLQIEKDVVRKIRKFISVGYDPKRAKLVEKGASPSEDKWRINRWAPLEVSIVKVPADPTVGVGRGGAGAETHPVEIEGGEPEEEVRSMTLKPITTDGEAPAAAAAALSTRGEGGPAATAATVTRDFTAERKEIRAMARGMKIEDKILDDWLDREFSPQQVAYEIQKLRAPQPRSTPSAEQLDQIHTEHVPGLPKDVRQNYRYQNAVLAAVGQHDRAAGKQLDGPEAETHQELLKRALAIGYTPRPGSILVPVSLRSEPEERQAAIGEMYFRSRMNRALDSKTATKGAELVTDQQYGEMIDLLRNYMALRSLGVRVLAGLSGGPIPFPKKTGGLTGQWIGENPATGVASSDMTFGLVTLQPKTYMALTAYSRQLLQQSSFDVEAMVREELAINHALAIDKAGIHGKGSAGEPTGIYNWPDVQLAAATGTVDFAEAVNMTGQAADKNAHYGSLGFITTALMAAAWKRTLEFGSAGSTTIWQGTYQDGQVAGYRAVASNQVSKTMLLSAETGGTSHGLIFGNWAEMIVGLWGVMELVVDPYSLKTKALIEVCSYQMGDQIIQHPEGFVKAEAVNP